VSEHSVVDCLDSRQSLGGEVSADGDVASSDGDRTLDSETPLDEDTDAAVTAHAIERVPELLDEEYANLLAKFDWEERFA